MLASQSHTCVVVAALRENGGMSKREHIPLQYQRDRSQKHLKPGDTEGVEGGLNHRERAEFAVGRVVMISRKKEGEGVV